jgi:hypothetical protein
MEVATVGNNTPFAEKVRLDSGSLRGTLSPIESVEVSAFDNFSIDSNKLMIAFSPQSVINEDIYEAIGNISIDDYFGEYSNINADEYPRLKWFAREYWQKYPNKNDFTAYINLISIFDFSVFDQIRQTLPARVNEILGLVIEPNILERSKVRVVKNFSGDSPEKTVFDTTELSSSLVPSANIQSYKSVLKIGFEDESEYDDFEGDINIETEVTADEDINVSGDVNVDVLAIGLRPQYVTYITGSNSAKPNLISTTKRYTTQISSTTSSLSSEYNKYVGNIVNKSSTKLDSETNSILDYGEINSAFTMTYKRTNVQKSTIVSGDLGYGVGWLTSSNETGKSTALFSPIEQYVNDTYYSGYKFRYTSSIDLAENNYSSYSLVTSSYLNPHNLPTSIRNHRFEGSKLSGPDINVDTRNTPDGKAVVEVFFVSPNQINTDQNIDTNVNGNLSAI